MGMGRDVEHAAIRRDRIGLTIFPRFKGRHLLNKDPRRIKDPARVVVALVLIPVEEIEVLGHGRVFFRQIERVGVPDDETFNGKDPEDTLRQLGAVVGLLGSSEVRRI